jgi:HEAT repeat protein
MKELQKLLDKESKLIKFEVESFILKHREKAGKLVLDLLNEGDNLSNNHLTVLFTQALPYIINDADYLKSLEKMLLYKRASDDLQFRIIQKIGWHGQASDSLRTYLEGLLEKKNKLKNIAAITLAELEYNKDIDKLVEYLISALEQEPNHLIRLHALKHLVKYEPQHTIIFDSLSKAIKSDPAFQVRQKIAYYLGELKKKAAIQLLIEVKDNDEHTLVRSVTSRVISDLEKL